MRRILFGLFLLAAATARAQTSPPPGTERIDNPSDCISAARAGLLGKNRVRRVTRPQIAEELALASVIRVGDEIDTAFELDGPLLLAYDRVPGLVYDGGIIAPPTSELWG